MNTRKSIATFVRCPRGAPTDYCEIVFLQSHADRFSIAAMPNDFFRDFLVAPRGAGCELLYHICDSVQRSLRRMYHIWPDGLSWHNTCGKNTAYVLRPRILNTIEAALNRDLCVFVKENADEMYWEDAANIIITSWKMKELFGNVPHKAPIGTAYHSLVYFEIKGRFDTETNSSGPLSSMFLAVETTGNYEIIGFYVAPSLAALRDLVHLMFKCNRITITQDQDTMWYSAVDQYKA